MILTNQRTKNYYIYKAKWIPDNPIETFNTFAEHLVVSEHIESSKIEALSHNYEDKYGYKLPLFILHPILNLFEKKMYAKKVKNEWHFDLSRIPQHDYDSVSDEFRYLYSHLINGFVSFCKSDDMNSDKAEKIISEFIEDNNINFQELDVVENFENTERYKLAQYLKEVQKSKIEIYDFIIQLCEATLIKSYILNEGCQQFTFTNKTIILDTPIVLRALGYAGTYLEEEYGFLLKCLLESRCRLEIFEHTYEEIYDILYAAKDWVESANFDLTKASDVCIYFRVNGKTRQDVIEAIEQLKNNIASLGISLIDEDAVNWNITRFVENQKQLTTLLNEAYQNGNYVKERTISTDVKSIMETYLVRKNNKVKVLNDATHFFLTSNNVLSRIVAQYNAKTHPKTISPVATDMFIGMLVCGENISKTKSLVNKRILSYCYSGFKPTMAMKEKFVQLVESKKDELEERNYLLLKNHPLVCETLISCTGCDINNINEISLWDILKEVQADLVVDTIQSYEAQIQEIAATNNEMITAKNAQIESLKIEQQAERKKHLNDMHQKDVEYARRDWEKWKKKANIVKIIIAISAAIFIAISIVCGINFHNEHNWLLICCIIGSIISFCLTATSIISWIDNIKVVSKIYNRHKKMIAQNYSVEIEEIGD